MKSPDHPVPSGDREMAQSILAALELNTLELPVTLASRLRCYDGQGDAKLQFQLRAQAETEVERILESGVDWQAWVTYHNYYKAPDLIGAAVCKHLNIPYLVIEASIAKRRLDGPWAEFSASADHATESADCIFYLTERDRLALAEYQPVHQELVHLPPFLNQTDLPAMHRKSSHNEIDRHGKHLLAVGMHRYGDKFASYRLLADALSYLQSQDWQLSIIGDGPARTDIELMFRDFGNRVSFLGQLDRSAVTEAYRQASLFVWPGVNEAFGMVYLEAQAAGLPVVAQDRPGVRDVIASSNSLALLTSESVEHAGKTDAQSIAVTIDRILADPSMRESMVNTGFEFIRSQHLLNSAARTLSEQLQRVIR